MKVFVKIGFDIPSWYITVFTVSYFLSELLRITEEGSFSFQETHRDTTIALNPRRKFFFKSLPTVVGQRRKFCFLEPLKRLFHHSVNTFLT